LILIQLHPFGLYDCPMPEIIRQRVGIDRCEGSLQTLFALTLMDLAEFEWRRPDGHGWEVGRWPGLRLTLLAQPESGPHQAPFAICPLPGNDNEVPFILLISLRPAIASSFSDTQCTSVSIFTVTPVELQRDPRSCAHRVFDRAVQLQLRHVEARFARHRQTLPGLPCMKATMAIAARFTAPMSGMETGMARQNKITEGSYGENSGHR
jgi:hypothetical protein